LTAAVAVAAASASWDVALKMRLYGFWNKTTLELHAMSSRWWVVAVMLSLSASECKTAWRLGSIASFWTPRTVYFMPGKLVLIT
jgi:hypothetical protein